MGSGLLGAPRGVDRHEVGDVLRDDTTSVELGVNEERRVGKPAQLRPLLDRDGVDSRVPQCCCYCGREHLVEEQLQP